MPTEEHYRRLERLYASAPTNAYYRPSLRVSRGAAELRIPFRPEFVHAARAVHGSVYFKALDDVAYFAANSLIEDVLVLTASFQIYFLRPIEDGDLLSRGCVVHVSRRLILAEGELHDAQGRLAARGSGAFMRSEIALGPDVGYA